MTRDELIDRIASGKAELLSVKKICQRLDISRTTLTKWLKAGHFPPPDLQNLGYTRWDISTLQTWLENRPHETLPQRRVRPAKPPSAVAREEAPLDSEPREPDAQTDH